MPKISCCCGNVINLSVMPSPDSFKLIQEEAYFTIYKQLEDLHNGQADLAEFKQAIVQNIVGNKHILQAYSCPNCG